MADRCYGSRSRISRSRSVSSASLRPKGRGLMQGQDSDAIVIGVFGALTYDVIAAACSSPQTTEINADTRADTLMKWVYIGIGQAALFTAIGAVAQQQEGLSPIPPIVGFMLASGMMWLSYVHAKRVGLESSEPGTEQ